MSALPKTILIIDDDRVFGASAVDYLSSDKLNVTHCLTAEAGLAFLNTRDADVVLLDQSLPDAEGASLCPKILKKNEDTKILFITAYPSFDNAVAAIKTGAHDYLSKPLEPEELRLAVNRALQTKDLERVVAVHNYETHKEGEETVLVGSSHGLATIRSQLRLARETDAPVLITGETGTGKNQAAKVVHYASYRRQGPLIAINCAALPENLMESELFGHEKGSFTGATSARKGIFELAEDGTLLLDEIGEMPMHLQSKLLGVLDSKEVRRIGAESARRVNVRIIAATSVDVPEAIRRKGFREDLYYRLSVIRIHMPPLRSRTEDIPALCRYLLARIPGANELILSDPEIDRLRSYPWPGNVRELSNILERAVILSSESSIYPSRLLADVTAAVSRQSFACSLSTMPSNDIRPLREIEREHISSVLIHFNGNYTRTARALGRSLSTIKRKIKEYGLARPALCPVPKITTKNEAAKDENSGHEITKTRR